MRCSALRTDVRQLAQLIDQILDDTFVHVLQSEPRKAARHARRALPPAGRAWLPARRLPAQFSSADKKSQNQV